MSKLIMNNTQPNLKKDNVKPSPIFSTAVPILAADTNMKYRGSNTPFEGNPLQHSIGVSGMASQLPLTFDLKSATYTVVERQNIGTNTKVAATTEQEQLPLWVGPRMNNFDFLECTANVKPKQVFSVVIEILEKLAKQHVVDFLYASLQYTISGRMFSDTDCCEFMIGLYRLDRTQSVIVEIKRMYGCHLCYYDLTDTITKDLLAKGLIGATDDNQDVDMLVRPAVSFRFNSMCDADGSSFMDEDEMTSEDELSISAMEEIQSYIDVVCNRKSYKEIYRSSACQLALLVKADSTMMTLARKWSNEDQSDTIPIDSSRFIVSLLAPLCDDLFDALIHTKILCFSRALLYFNQKCTASEELNQMLHKIKKIWTEGVSGKEGSSQHCFMPSQTAVYWADECIELISQSA